jgi:hypothetical protein
LEERFDKPVCQVLKWRDHDICSANQISPAIRRTQLENSLLPGYGERFNPLLRCTVRRTRGYLEDTINPATGSYYLPRVTVRLFGEDNKYSKVEDADWESCSLVLDLVSVGELLRSGW